MSLIRPLTKRRLQRLIRIHGLQCDLFDNSRFLFDWEVLVKQNWALLRSNPGRNNQKLKQMKTGK